MTRLDATPGARPGRGVQPSHPASRSRARVDPPATGPRTHARDPRHARPYGGYLTTAGRVVFRSAGRPARFEGPSRHSVQLSKQKIAGL